MELPTYHDALEMRYPIHLKWVTADLFQTIGAVVVCIAFGVVTRLAGLPLLDIRLDFVWVIATGLGYIGTGMEMPAGRKPWTEAWLASRHLLEARWTTGWGMPISEPEKHHLKVVTWRGR